MGLKAIAQNVARKVLSISSDPKHIAIFFEPCTDHISRIQEDRLLVKELDW